MAQNELDNHSNLNQVVPHTNMDLLDTYISIATIRQSSVNLLQLYILG